jgi:hypothetical protein
MNPILFLRGVVRGVWPEALSTSNTCPATERLFYARKTRAFSNNIHEMRKQRVITIRAIKAVISIGPACDQACGAEISQLFLNCAQS